MNPVQPATPIGQVPPELPRPQPGPNLPDVKPEDPAVVLPCLPVEEVPDSPEGKSVPDPRPPSVLPLIPTPHDLHKAIHRPPINDPSINITG